ncbi:MAG: hypothetical protein M3Y30_13310 [Gemmatimonadota bacterium]|nr:hypothetical protein [Gemmatimonadota bacterium]
MATAGAVARCGRPSRVALCAIVLATTASAALASKASAQATGPDAGTVDGRVMRPRLKALAPAGGVWVTIHRVASDTAGPLDSMRVGADGHFHFRYSRAGKPSAVFFVSAMYDGIAYFSRPLTTSRVTGDDAAIVVFDTTSIHFPLAIKGRHVVISTPSVDGSREVVEAYEIANESDQTLVAPDDAHPTWTAPLPAGVTDIQVGESDVSPAAISAASGRARVTAPFAPGLKQLSYSYRIPQSSFPLHVPLEQGVSVLELLLEEPKAQGRGATLKPVAPATIERRVFQRYLGTDAPAGSSMEIEVPVIQAAASVRVYWKIAGALAALMLAGLVAWYARTRRAGARAMSPSRAPRPSATETLARQIATLDAEFESGTAADDAARAAYEAERRELKRELASALDASAHSS